MTAPTVAGHGPERTAGRVRALVLDEGTGVWGAQRFLLRLAPLLHDRGVDQVLAAPAGSAVADAWTAAGFAHVALDVPDDRAIRTGNGRISPALSARELGRTLRQARRVARLVRETDADVVHANVHWSHLDGVLGARLARCRSVLLLHEETLPGAAPHLRALAVRLADQSVAVSRAVGDGVPAWARERVVVVPNGVDTTVLAPGPADATVRRQLAADPTRPVVLAMSRLDPTKGVDHVIRAVAATPTDLGVQLAVAGAPSLDPTWEPYLRRLGDELLGERVRFLGPRHDVGDVLRAVDALALASSCEGMPLSVLEAQACGTPVVCYPTAGIPEIVEHERTGLLVPVGDMASLAAALARVVTEPGLRDRLVAAARLSVEREHGLGLQADRLAAALVRP